MIDNRAVSGRVHYTTMTVTPNIIDVGPIIDGKERTGIGVASAELINPATDKVIAQEACCDRGTVGRIRNGGPADLL